ncbi:Alpha/Beta hydrolase protein [Fennellomyces sp. T-0311]|nr:Alpha/Beta hydrolase protein [Fennellomyces sp. T-0311]
MWFAWAFWCEHIDHVDEAVALEIEWMIKTMEVRYNIKFADGYNSRIRCIRPTLDEFDFVHRPLLLYIANFAFTGIFNTAFLRAYGKFRRYGCNLPGVRWGGIFSLLFMKKQPTPDANQHKHLSYWYREATIPTKPTPIVFVHGIGTGLPVYAEFVHRLCQLGRPLFCVELPYVSSRLVEHVPSPEDTVSEIEMMLTTHGFDKAIIVAHSLGTAVASWMSTLAPHRISGFVLIDPICFLLHYHHVAYNMLYRVPTEAFEYFIHYFASRELYISYYITRHFHWHQTISFVHEAPTAEYPVLPVKIHESKSSFHNATVFLSENDAIVDSPLIAKYLTDRTVNTVIMTQLAHAEFLIRDRWRKQIISQVEEIASNIEDEAVEL